MSDVLISYAVPCHSRLADLIESLPSVIAAANASPPIELVIVDYGGKDWIEPRVDLTGLSAENRVTFVVYRGREYFHCTHARNLGIRAAHGEYVMASSADIGLAPTFFVKIREVLQASGAALLVPSQRQPGFSICKREELIAAGGFDERFEFYGPDDRDLVDRLKRRGVTVAGFPYSQLRVRPTPHDVKLSGYRKQLSMPRTQSRMGKIYRENIATGVLVANEGIEWGAFDAPKAATA